MTNNLARAIDTDLSGLRTTQLERVMILENALGGKKVKKKLSVGFVLAIVLLLAMMGVALATISGGVIDYLYPDRANDIDESLRSMVRSVDASGTLENITVSITEAIYDGERLALSYTVENTQPNRRVLVELDKILVNGKRFSPWYETLATGWMPAFFRDNATSGRVTASSGVLGSLDLEEGTTSVTIDLSFAVSESSRPIVIVDEWATCDPQVIMDFYQEDYYLKQALDFREALANDPSITIAPADQMDVEEWYQQGYTVLEFHGEFLREQDFSFSGFERGHRPDQMREVGLAEVSFDLNVENASDILQDITPEETFVLPDCTARIRHATLSPLGLVVEYEIVPPSDTYEEVVDYFYQYGQLTFTDENGEPVIFPDMYGDREKYPEEIAPDRFVLRGNVNMPPPLGDISELHFHFTNSLEASAENQSRLDTMEETVYLKLK